MNINLLMDIWEFAAFKHKEQKVPNSDLPYLLHLGKVSSIVSLAKLLNPEEKFLALAVAILHDTIEDVGVMYDEIKEKFGKEIADGVLAISKNNLLETKEEQMQDSLSRIKEQPIWVWAVKIADRICNMYNTPISWSVTKKTKYKEEAKLILSSLTHEKTQDLALLLNEAIENYSLNSKKVKF